MIGSMTLTGQSIMSQKLAFPPDARGNAWSNIANRVSMGYCHLGQVIHQQLKNL
jgi:hypothetical protein